MICLIQPRRLLAYFTMRKHCCLMTSLLSIRTLGCHNGHPSLLNFLLANQLPEFTDAHVILPQMQNFSCLLLDLMRFLFSQFSSLFRSIGMAAQPSHLSAISSFLPANFLRAVGPIVP